MQFGELTAFLLIREVNQKRQTAAWAQKNGLLCLKPQYLFIFRWEDPNPKYPMAASSTSFEFFNPSITWMQEERHCDLWKWNSLCCWPSNSCCHMLFGLGEDLLFLNYEANKTSGPLLRWTGFMPKNIKNCWIQTKFIWVIY